MSEETPLPVGTRIRFTKTLIQAASGDHPTLLYAEKGTEGEITGHGCREGYWVKWDRWPHPFGASRDEFEVVIARPVDEPSHPIAEDAYSLYGKTLDIPNQSAIPVCDNCGSRGPQGSIDGRWLCVECVD